jgi:hypothetical protein
VLTKKVIFQVTHLKMQGSWAFLYGTILQPNGKPFSFKGTPMEKDWKDGFFTDSFCGLLHKKSGKWTVRDSVVGMTDVTWIGWDKKYKAPKAIFPNL